jgi:hypothetical protein
MRERDEESVGTYSPSQQAEIDVAERSAACWSRISGLQDAVASGLGQSIQPIAANCAAVQSAVMGWIESRLEALCTAQQTCQSAIDNYLASRCGSMSGVVAQLQAIERRAADRLRRRGHPDIVTTADVMEGPCPNEVPQSPTTSAGPTSPPAPTQPVGASLPTEPQICPAVPTHDQLVGLFAPMFQQPAGFALALLPTQSWDCTVDQPIYFSLVPTPTTACTIPILREVNGEFNSAGLMFINLRQNIAPDALAQLLQQLGTPTGVMACLTPQQAWDTTVAIFGDATVRLVYGRYGLTPVGRPPSALPPLREVPVGAGPPPQRGGAGTTPEDVEQPVPAPDQGVDPAAAAAQRIVAGWLDRLRGIRLPGTGPVQAQPVPPVQIPIQVIEQLGGNIDINQLVQQLVGQNPTLSLLLRGFTLQNLCAALSPVIRFFGIDPALVPPCATMESMDAWLKRQ